MCRFRKLNEVTPSHMCRVVTLDYKQKKNESRTSHLSYLMMMKVGLSLWAINKKKIRVECRISAI